jgi:hypothetical protein
MIDVLCHGLEGLKQLGELPADAQLEAARRIEALTENSLPQAAGFLTRAVRRASSTASARSTRLH